MESCIGSLRKCSICLMLKAPPLCAGKSDYIDASAYFDIQLHVMQSYHNISNVLSCKVKMVKNGEK